LASCKRWIKRKLLNNFKKAYVDVISRQQSAFNRQMLTALAELAECCTTLDHVRTAATPFAGGSDVAALLERLTERLSESERRATELEARLAQLESALALKEEVPA